MGEPGGRGEVQKIGVRKGAGKRTGGEVTGTCMSGLWNRLWCCCSPCYCCYCCWFYYCKRFSKIMWTNMLMTALNFENKSEIVGKDTQTGGVCTAV